MFIFLDLLVGKHIYMMIYDFGKSCLLKILFLMYFLILLFLFICQQLYGWLSDLKNVIKLLYFFFSNIFLAKLKSFIFLFTIGMYKSQINTFFSKRLLLQNSKTVSFIDILLFAYFSDLWKTKNFSFLAFFATKGSLVVTYKVFKFVKKFWILFLNPNFFCWN